MKPIFSIFNFLKGLKTTKFLEVPSGTAVKMYGKDADDNLVEDDVPSGGAAAFTELSDVPQSYTDQAGKMVVVNEGETALEFTDVPSGGGATAFIELSDVPQSYTDQAGKMLVVNDDEDALEFTDVTETHTHTNKDILDGIIDTGDGDEFLADDGTYKTIDAGLEYFDENRNNSSPNAAVPAHQLIVKGDETNIDLVLSSKGAGAIIAQIPDGTATGGNKRGNNAVDFQKKRNNANQVATSLGSGVIAGANNRVGTSTSDTANYSFIGAGTNNYIAGSLIGKTCQFIGAGSGNACDVKCSGIMAGETNTIHTSNYGGSCAIAAGKSNYINVPAINGKGYMAIVAGESNWCGKTHSIIGAGLGNNIDGEYAGILSGSYGKVKFYGQQAHASGRFTATGDAQRSDYVLRGNVLTTNYYRLYLDGASALIDLSQAGAYSTWQCKLKVTGIRKLTGSIDHYNSEHNFMIYRENSTPVIADLTEIHTHQVGGSSVATGVYITTNSLAIDIATTESDWQFVAHLETVETFAASLV